MAHNFVTCKSTRDIINKSTILVISGGDFCEKFCTAFNKVQSLDKDSSELFVHFYFITCDHISDVLEFSVQGMSVDFVVFLIDTNESDCIQEVEENLALLQSSLICGRLCLINATCNLPLSKVKNTLDSLADLITKYKSALINGNLNDEDSCYRLAKRVMCLFNPTKVQMPFLSWQMRAKHLSH